MKNLCFAILAIIFSTGIKTKHYIILEHVGDSDKSISTIIINKSHVKVKDALFNESLHGSMFSDTYQFIVNDRYYDTIQNSGLKYKSDFKLINDPMGTYRISIHDGNSVVIFFVHAQDSPKLFEDLIKIVKETGKHEDLLERLKMTLKRI